MSAPDISQLTDAQQTALQTFLAVTDSDPIKAIPILHRSEWNVQIAISRLFDGEPVSDPVAEAAASVPVPSTRQTSNLQYESLIANTAHRRASPVGDVVQRVDTNAAVIPVYQPQFLLSILFTPISILFSLVGTVLSPL